MTNELTSNLLSIYGKYMHLKIFIDTDDRELINKYNVAINERNLKMTNNINHIDAGFDLFSPHRYSYECHSPQPVSGRSFKIDYQTVCSAQIIESDKRYNTGFYMYPRSSISKSNLRLANNVGIIDAGYRGHLIGAFDVHKDIPCILSDKFERHVQICAPGLIPIFVEIVDYKEDLGELTTRGDGGFGSTGK